MSIPRYNSLDESNLIQCGVLCESQDYSIIKCKHALSKTYVIAKSYTFNNRNDELYKQASHEIEYLLLLKGANYVISPFAIIEEQNRLCIILEYASMHDIKSHLRVIPVDLRLKLVFQLVVSVTELHSRGLFHGDLCIENLLIQDGWDLRLTNFSQCTPLHTSYIKESKNRNKGQAFCRPPEWISSFSTHLNFNSPSTGHMAIASRLELSKVDSFAVGVLSFIILAGLPPWAVGIDASEWYSIILSSNKDDQLKFFVKDALEEQFESHSRFSDIVDFLCCMMHADASNRLGVAESLQHSLLNGFVSSFEPPDNPFVRHDDSKSSNKQQSRASPRNRLRITREEALEYSKQDL